MNRHWRNFFNLVQISISIYNELIMRAEMILSKNMLKVRNVH